MIGLFFGIILSMFPTESLGTPNPWKQIINENLEQCVFLYKDCIMPKSWKEAESGCPENYIKLGFVDEKDRCSPPYIPPIPSHPDLPNTPEFKRARLMADCLKFLNKLVVRRTRNEILARGGRAVCSSESYGVPLNRDRVSLNKWRENIWKKDFPTGCYDPNEPRGVDSEMATTEQAQLNLCYRKLADERARLTGPVVTSNVRPPRLLVKRSQVHYPSVESVSSYHPPTVESVSSYHPPTVGPVSSYHPPTVGPVSSYVLHKGESESTVDKMKKTEKKLKRRTVLTGIATIALGLHARKCCFGPMGAAESSSTTPHDPATGVDPAKMRFPGASLDLLNPIKYALPPFLSMPLVSLTYSPQCKAMMPSFASCATPKPPTNTYPIYPQCPIFSALALAAAVQTFNIHKRRKDIANTRKKLETKPKACQNNGGSMACVCALHPYIRECSVQSLGPDAPKVASDSGRMLSFFDKFAPCRDGASSNACTRAICRAYPDSPDCISTAFHPFCIEQPEQCDALAEVLNTCEGDACHKKITALFTPKEGWPTQGLTQDKDTSTAGVDELTSEQKEEIKKLVASYMQTNTNSTGTLAGETGGDTQGGDGKTTKEDLANQMNSILDSAFSGRNTTATLAGSGNQVKGHEGEVTKEDLASQMNSILDSAFSGGGATATLTGDLGYRTPGSDGENQISKADLAQQMTGMLDIAFGGSSNSTATLAGDVSENQGQGGTGEVSKTDLASQMQSLLSTVDRQRALDGSHRRNAISFRNPPLQMGSDLIGSKKDNIFFMTHGFHRALCDQGYCIN